MLSHNEAQEAVVSILSENARRLYKIKNHNNN
jgi:hypothetical protein